MFRNPLINTLLTSITLHVILVVSLLTTKNLDQVIAPQPSITVDLQIQPGIGSSKPKSEYRKKFNLRPEFMTGITGKTSRENLSVGNNNEKSHQGAFNSVIQNENARELLYTNSKVTFAFDHLAEKINFYLDYPMILIENNIQGTATLDLVFDENGNVDAGQSRFFGSNRATRGLLVKASRNGIEKWYETDAFKLHKDEFKNQHFRAEFEISYTQESLNKMEKTTTGNYSMIRRHYRHECAAPTGVDLVCLAMKAKGAVESTFSDAYKVRLHQLQDQLDHYDEIGLSGIRTTI